jgi:hypothetical protein
MNWNNFGCGAMIALAFLLVLALKMIELIGIPVAIIGLAAAGFLFLKKEESERRRKNNVQGGIVLSIGALLIGGIALSMASKSGSDSSFPTSEQLARSEEDKPTPAQCDAIRQTTPRFASMIKADCARQYGGRTGGSMLTNICLSQAIDDLRNCGEEVSLE